MPIGRINEMNDNERDLKLRRSRIGILVDMLRVINKKGGVAKPTHILYGANLSHKRLSKYLDWLESEQMVEKMDMRNRILYRITEKGQQFILEFKKVEKFSEAFGIEI